MHLWGGGVAKPLFSPPMPELLHHCSDTVIKWHLMITVTLFIILFVIVHNRLNQLQSHHRRLYNVINLMTTKLLSIQYERHSE